MGDGVSRKYSVQLILTMILGMGLSLTIPAVMGVEGLGPRFAIFVALFVLPTGAVMLHQRRVGGESTVRRGPFDKIALVVGAVLAVAIVIWAVTLES